MAIDLPRDLVRRATKAVDGNDTLSGLMLFEEAARHALTPQISSYLGYCIARERRQFRQAVELCEQALRDEPNRALHYLNLGRVYLLAGQKGLAIKTFRMGMRRESSRQILLQLEQLGLRRPPLFVRYSRTHPLNRHLGMVLSKVGLR